MPEPFCYFSYVAYKVKQHFYSDKAANLLNTLDSLIENYPQVIEQRQSAINRIASKPMPNTLQARYEHNKRLFQEYQYFNIDRHSYMSMPILSLPNRRVMTT